ncbi:retrovirus-related pol polyprotein from transposon TNT 1-94 [Tanacetum coccineum]
MFTPSGYKWTPSSPNRKFNTNVNMPRGNASRETAIILDYDLQGVPPYPYSILLSNFMEKFLGKVKFGNDQIAAILGYEDLNHTLVEAARTMLSATKVPLFFWAEAVATTCFTQNSSLIFLVMRKQLTTSSMAKNWYSTQSRAYRVYNKRTRVIVETIHVNFEEFPHMASDHVIFDPVPQCPTTALEDDSLIIVPAGSVIVPTGSVVTTGSVIVPTGSVVTTGSVIVPAGSVIVPTGSVVTTGSVIVPAGSVIVPAGERKCFKCRDPNHLVGECPKLSRYQNQKAFVGGSWSDSDEDEEEKTNDEKCLMANSLNEHPNVTIPLLPDFGGVTDGIRAKKEFLHRYPNNPGEPLVEAGQRGKQDGTTEYCPTTVNLKDGLSALDSDSERR